MDLESPAQIRCHRSVADPAPQHRHSSTIAKRGRTRGYAPLMPNAAASAGTVIVARPSRTGIATAFAAGAGVGVLGGLIGVGGPSSASPS